MQKRHKIRVAIVDDHHVVRAGIAALLRKESDIEVAVEASNGQELLEKLKSVHLDVVVMDISMPTLNGIEATSRIRHAGGPRVIILTQYDHEEYIKRVMQAGANGYVPKSAIADELLRGIRAVHRGEQFFTPAVSRVMVDSFVRSATGANGGNGKGHTLTNREREILQLIAEGNTNQHIAETLFISVRTVEFHRANIIEKLGVHDTASLVKYAIQNRIISLDM
ncbi:MAG: response regulator transcription factor [Bacteroidota bacterium]